MHSIIRAELDRISSRSRALNLRQNVNGFLLELRLYKLQETQIADFGDLSEVFEMYASALEQASGPE